MNSSGANIASSCMSPPVTFNRHEPLDGRPHQDTPEQYEIWPKQQQMEQLSPGDIPIETTIISTASLVLSHFPDRTDTREVGSCSRTETLDTNLSDYENNSPSTPPQGTLSKSSSASSSCSFIARPFGRSVHSLSSTSLSSISFSTFQPIEFPQSSNYLFHASDCEDQSDYVPLNIFRTRQGVVNTPSPLISRPSSPLPPTHSPNFSRSPSPNRSSRRFQRSFSPGRPNTNSGPGSPKFTRSLNPSREPSPLRLRPSSYTRPLSPNPPTMSPGPSRGQSPRSIHTSMCFSSSSHSIRSQPSSPESRARSAFHNETMYPSAGSQAQLSSALSVHRNISLRSPPSPTRPATALNNSRSPNQSPLNFRSPVTSRPPSPMNAASRHQVWLLPNARPARSQSQPPVSPRLHSRASRSTRTPSPRPPRLPPAPGHRTQAREVPV
ncbi:serine/arginine repetitive matrix protein 1 [Hyalella azteca]|uniref:Serine/arginine repetitive matrix protein 1 n=1 Tax=Hyalella azteca TaxID=294128 RepID=A0A8B7NY45_HYAAZ|nr:serine/arginine repetitive matrix protein 1 [Hyalella azteca]